MPLRKDRGFDLAKLQAMIEPLGVRVEKLRNSTKMPIELPPKDGATPGIGWTRDEIMKLEGFLLNQWTGGGYYTAKIADAEGTVMEWDFGWDPKVFPEKNPPNQSEATNVANNPSNSQNVTLSPTQGPLGSSPPSNFPPPAYTSAPMPVPMAPAPAPVAAAPTSTAYAPPAMSYTPPPWYWNNNGSRRRSSASLFDDDDDIRVSNRKETEDRIRKEAEERAKREAEEHARKLEARLQELERERMQDSHKAEIERLNAQNQTMLAAMQQEIRKLADGHKEDPEKEALRKQIEENREKNLQAQMEQMRFAYEQQAAMLKAELERVATRPVEDPSKSKIDDFMRMMERQREESERQIAKQREDFEREREKADRLRAEEKAEERHREELRAMNEKLEKTITTLQVPRQDPILELMKEQARQQTEIAREQTRAQEAQITKFAPFMVSPIQLAQLMKDNTSQADLVLNKVVQSFGGIFDTYRGVMESVAQVTGASTPAPSPALGIIQDGLVHAKEVGEQFLAMKRDQSVAESKARTAEAAARAETARAQTETVRAQATAMQLQAAQASQNTTNLTRQRQVASSGLNGAVVEATAESAPMTAKQATPQVSAADSADKRELEVFGPAYESVKRLQKGVIEGHLTPEQVIDAVLQGIAIAQSQNMEIPAFELLADERFADLVDLLIPQATSEFRQECVTVLLKKLEVEDVEDNEEVEEPVVSEA